MPAAWRVTKARHPPYDAGGALLVGGRWNPPGRAVIYAADSFAGALLGILRNGGLLLLWLFHPELDSRFARRDDASLHQLHQRHCFLRLALLVNLQQVIAEAKLKSERREQLLVENCLKPARSRRHGFVIKRQTMLARGGVVRGVFEQRLRYAESDRDLLTIDLQHF